MNLSRIAGRHLVSLTQPLRMRRDYGSADGDHWGAYESEPKRPLFWDQTLEDAVRRAGFWAHRRPGESVLIFKGPRPPEKSSKPVKRVGPAREEPLEFGIEPEIVRPGRSAPWPPRE